MNKSLKRFKKEIVSLVLLLLIILSISTYVTYRQVSNSLSKVYLEKLSVLKSALSTHISSYFENKKKIVISLSCAKTVHEAVADFNAAFKSTQLEYTKEYKQPVLIKNINDYLLKVSDKVPNSLKKRDYKEYIPKTKTAQILQSEYVAQNPFWTQERYKLYASSADISYDKIHKKYQKYFFDELKRYDIYDIYLINLDGDIIYSVFKENDFATNLKNGVYSKSSLADTYKNTLENSTFTFTDFKPYEPSFNKPTAFMAAPIYENSKIIAVLAIQLSIDSIDKAMTLDSSQKEVGLGESGEAYLVGSDKYMRSNSRYLSDIHNPLVDELSTTIGVLKINADSVIMALDGKSGEHITNDYRDVKVFSSYAPIKIFDKNWAIITDIDAQEIYGAINESVKSLIRLNFILLLPFLALVWYLFIKFILKPMENHEELLAENILLREKEAESSQAILGEYKKAVDISAIVSKATPKGIITFVNDAFCDISGYTRDELIGKAHNIVRHPDMAKETFEELWNTISRKKVWKGVIKNLKKDGTDYYVNSTIVPIIDENDEIKEFISIRSDITELTKVEKQLINKTTDLVTSLPNRVKLMEDIKAVTKEQKLAIVEIKKFKEVNDFYGIEIGDLLIRNISVILQKIVDKDGIKVYKAGGDEFAILESSELSVNEFTKIITNLIKYFDHNVVVVNNNSFNISINVGLSIGDKNKLFYNSEMALRKAIESSSSFVAYEHSQDVEKEYQENINMTIKIKDAIQNDNIVIYAQPIKANTQNKKEKLECLVRMIDGDKVISPFFFLDIAKKARLYPTITKIVIEKSFEHFRDSESEFSINLNIEDILDKDIVIFLKRKIKEYRIGHRLVLELVESEGIENFEHIDIFIKEMKAFGCKIAIDDFGTGYSNFEYLMKLNADFIKIDGSLIKNIEHDDNSKVVVELIVAFAKRMNIQTIGEFVHNEAVQKIVKEMGIDYSQGYYLGEPKPV